MSERNPFDLNPSQDLTNADRFSLVRDDPAAAQNAAPYADQNMQNMAPYGGYNAQNTAQYGNYNMPNAGYGYNGQVGRASPSPNGGGQMSGIYETMQQMETLRKSIYSRGVFIVIILVSMMVLLFVMIPAGRGVYRSRGYAFLIPVLTIVPIIIMANGMTKKKKQLKQLYKETFVNQLLRQHFGDVMYDWSGGFSETQVRHSGMCRLGNRYHTEDYISASWNGVHFEQADVKIQYHTSSGKSSHTTTYFEGRMFVFDYTRKMTLPLQIHSKSFRYAGAPEYGMPLQKVEMEDVNFNKRFVVKSTSPHDAFYVLTPQMMQRVMQMEQHYGRITMVIVNGKLYVGIDNRLDAFDPQYTRPIEYTKERERMLEDVKVIEELIQILNCLP